VRIGVISDTHGIVPAWEKAVELFADADLILHAGDVLYHPPKLRVAAGYDIPGLIQLINNCPIPLVIARGNCDAEFCDEALDIPALSPYVFVQFDDLRIVVRHGHDVTPDQMRQLAGKYGAHVLVTGHTHLPVVERLGEAIHLNPGSPSYPFFEKDGVPTPTVGLIADGQVRILPLETGEEVASMPLV
jgi:putative phosphoesterase